MKALIVIVFVASCLAAQTNPAPNVFNDTTQKVVTSGPITVLDHITVTAPLCENANIGGRQCNYFWTDYFGQQRMLSNGVTATSTGFTTTIPPWPSDINGIPAVDMEAHIKIKMFCPVTRTYDIYEVVIPISQWEI